MRRARPPSCLLAGCAGPNRSRSCEAGDAQRKPSRRTARSFTSVGRRSAGRAPRRHSSRRAGRSAARPVCRGRASSRTRSTRARRWCATIGAANHRREIGPGVAHEVHRWHRRRFEGSDGAAVSSRGTSSACCSPLPVTVRSSSAGRFAPGETVPTAAGKVVVTVRLRGRRSGSAGRFPCRGARGCPRSSSAATSSIDAEPLAVPARDWPVDRLRRDARRVHAGHRPDAPVPQRTQASASGSSRTASSRAPAPSC